MHQKNISPQAASFSFFFFFFFLFLFFRLNQHYPLEYVKAEITKNETLWSVNETAQAVLNLLLVSSAIYWVRHD